MNAAINDNMEVAKLLIQSNFCNINAQDEDGNTALIWAACNGHTEIVRLILQKDCSSMDVQTVVNKRTALMDACEHGFAAIIELLICSGADLSFRDKDNKTAFKLLDEEGGELSEEEKNRLMDLPRLIRPEQLQHQYEQYEQYEH